MIALYLHCKCKSSAIGNFPMISPITIYPKVNSNWKLKIFDLVFSALKAQPISDLAEKLGIHLDGEFILINLIQWYDSVAECRKCSTFIWSLSL